MAEVIVTGASGLVGTALGTALERDGATVRRLSLRDPTKPIDLAAADAVVHLAGETVAGRWTDAKREAILASRRDGTRRLVDAIEAMTTRPKVLLSASAIGWYGDRGDEVLTERSPGGLGFLADVCRVWEAQAARAEALGVRLVVLRTGVVMARQAMALRRLVLPFRFGAGGPLGPGTQWWSWVHIDDVVGIATAALADERYQGPVNLTAPGSLVQREFARTLGRVLRRPALAPTPAFVLRAALGDFSTELLWSRRVIPTRALDLGYRFAHPELDGALRHLLKRS